MEIFVVLNKKSAGQRVVSSEACRWSSRLAAIYPVLPVFGSDLREDLRDENVVARLRDWTEMQGSSFHSSSEDGRKKCAAALLRFRRFFFAVEPWRQADPTAALIAHKSS